MSAFYSTVIIVSSSPVPAGILNLTTTIKETGEVRKLTNYFDGEKTNTYIDTNGEKIALLN